MVALPDYNREKQEAIIEKQKLEERISKLKENIRNEQVKSFLVMLFSLVFI
jgi:hypoxanthine-guanine phosphoribosyltransferase